MRPGTGGWHQRGSARSLRDIDIMKATGQSWNQERCRARAGINMSVHTHVAAVLANSWIWIPFPRPTTTVTLVAMALPEITLRRSSRTTRRARATRRHRLRISGFHGRVQQAQACLCRYVGPGAATLEGRDCPGASHTGGTAGREASPRGCRDGREAKGKLCRLLHTNCPKVKRKNAPNLY